MDIYAGWYHISLIGPLRASDFQCLCVYVWARMDEYVC